MSEAPGALQRPAKLFQVIFIMDESAASQISFGVAGLLAVSKPTQLF